MDIDQIYDISGLRIIVPEMADCYSILGLIHNLYKPVPNRLKDYIASPKPNGYQSIHTAVFLSDGLPVEIQIRSQLMHKEAELGVASHLAYDETGKPKAAKNLLSRKLAWITDLLHWQSEVRSEEEFLDHLKTDFFVDRIFTFTPKNDVIELPKGATALDFAYAIHSDIGHRAVGAIINGKMKSLSTVLNNHDQVLIDVKKDPAPNAKWLQITKTTMAKKHIRNWLQKEEVKKTKVKN